jgi:uncharacterized protein (TIGR03083 family)
MEAPSACAGWTVRTVLAHVTLSAAALAGLVSAEPADPDVEFESGVDARARKFAERPAGELVDLFRSSVPAVVGTFASLPAEFAAAPIPMGTAGTYPFGAMVDALTFDHTCHIRWDVLRPRGPVSRDLPAVEPERLTATVRWLMRGVPQMTSPAFRTRLTDPITLVFTDIKNPTSPAEPTATYRLMPGPGQVIVEPSPTEPARSTVHTTAAGFILWSTGREPRESRVRLEGDAEYANQALAEFRVY